MTATSTFLPQSITSDVTSTRGSVHPGATPEEVRRGPKRPGREALRRNASDDEILGIALDPEAEPAQLALDFDQDKQDAAQDANAEPAGARTPERRSETDSEALQGILEQNPELRRAWDAAEAYRQAFATPEEAQAATALLADLDKMDALFFSRRPEDHTALARSLARMDPIAFASLARAMQQTAAGPIGTLADPPQGAATTLSFENDGAPPVSNPEPTPTATPQTHPQEYSMEKPSVSAQMTPQQAAFLHAANTAAVQNVIDTVEGQVGKLLPEGTPKGARNRIVGEIYRELDSALQSNRQLAQQMRQAFRSGALDAAHQRTLVSLITARARQALPSIAKRVLSEWTSTVLAAQHGRQERQKSAERRVDIAGTAGNASGRRPMSPREVDYARLSDSDILNL